MQFWIAKQTTLLAFIFQCHWVVLKVMLVSFGHDKFSEKEAILVFRMRGTWEPFAKNHKLIFASFFRWFCHFYVVAVIWNGILLLWLIQSLFFSWPFPVWLQDLLRILGEASQDGTRGTYGSENVYAFNREGVVHVSLFKQGATYRVRVWFSKRFHQ